jgi:cytochrome c oxidase assembly factor CtaG
MFQSSFTIRSCNGLQNLLVFHDRLYLFHAVWATIIINICFWRLASSLLFHSALHATLCFDNIILIFLLHSYLLYRSGLTPLIGMIRNRLTIILTE